MKPTYKVHRRTPEHITLMSRCLLYTCSNYIHNSFNGQKKSAMHRHWFVIYLCTLKQVWPCIILQWHFKDWKLKCVDLAEPNYDLRIPGLMTLCLPSQTKPLSISPIRILNGFSSCYILATFTYAWSKFIAIFKACDLQAWWVLGCSL